MVSGLFIRGNQPALLGILAINLSIYDYGTITLYGQTFQGSSSLSIRFDTSPHSTSPHTYRVGIRFDLFRFRSPLLTESHLLSFPALIMMLRFSTFLLPHLMDMGVTQYYLSYDVTFGYLRIVGYLHLPGAYRSLSRPSSDSKPRHPLYSVGVWTLIRNES